MWESDVRLFGNHFLQRFNRGGKIFLVDIALRLVKQVIQGVNNLFRARLRIPRRRVLRRRSLLLRCNFARIVR